MKIFQRILSITFTVAILFSGLSAPASAAVQPIPKNEKPKFKAGEIVIRYKSDPADAAQSQAATITRFASINDRHKKHKVRSQKKVFEKNKKAHKRGKRVEEAEDRFFSNTFVLQVDENADIEKIIADYKKDPNVDFVEPNRLVGINATTPNDPEISKQSGLYRMRAFEGWDLEKGNGQVVVAVVDTGVDFNHQDLSANIWANTEETAGNGIDDDANGFIDDVKGWNFVSLNNSPLDDHSHGTHVAGIIGAVSNNAKGVAGVANCKIMPVKGISSAGWGTEVQISNAIRYAADNGAKIINCSFGDTTESALIRAAVDYAINTYGILVVAGAGNNNSSAPFYPAFNDNVLAVASTDAWDRKSGFSNYGTWVDISAPGSDIYSTIPNNQYGNMSGTSMASPQVAGVAALFMSHFPTYTSSQIRTLMLSGSQDHYAINPSYVGMLGQGRADIFKTLTMNDPSYTVIKGYVKDVQNRPVRGKGYSAINVHLSGGETKDYAPGMDGSYEFIVKKGFDYDVTPQNFTDMRNIIPTLPDPADLIYYGYYEHYFDAESLHHSSLNSPAVDQNFTIKAGQRYAISGSVKGALSIGIPGVEIAAACPSGNFSKTTDVSGSYKFEFIDPTSAGGVCTLAPFSETHNILPESDAVYLSAKHERNFTGEPNLWTRRLLDPVNATSNPFSSIAVDSTGKFHEIHYDVTAKSLKYGSSVDGITWSVQTVDSGNVGTASSLTIDALDNVHVAYFDATNLDLKYAKIVGGVATISVVDSVGDVGRNTSIAVDHNNFPHITYTDKKSTTVYDLKYTAWNGSNWTTQTLEAGGRMGVFGTKIQIDSQNRPHIAFSDGTNAKLKYQVWNGSSWEKEIVDPAISGGQFPSMKLDSSDHPHITYRDATNGGFRYITKTVTGWSTPIPMAGSLQAFLEVNSAGVPMVVYYNSGDSNLYFVRDVRTGGTNIVEYFGTNGTFHSFTLDQSGNPVLFYVDAKESRFKIATRNLNDTPLTYLLTVDQGSGSGTYTAGQSVTISANYPDPYSGMEFDKWVGATVANPNSFTTTMVMPAAKTTVTATYRKIQYSVQVDNGSGDGNYGMGDIVTISADPAPADYVFDKWVGAAVANPKSPTTTLTMPASNVVVSATYKFWNISFVDVASHDALYFYTSADMDVDSAGNPYMVYLDREEYVYSPWVPNPQPLGLRLAEKDAPWKFQHLPGTSNAWEGQNVRMRVDSLGNVHVLYFDYTQSLNRLIYEKRTGQTWSSAILAGRASQFEQDSVTTHALAVDKNGNAHCAYSFRLSNQYVLRYAKWNGSEWVTEQVGSAGANYFKPLIEVAGDGNPHILRNSASGLQYLKWSGTAWITEDFPVDVVKDFAFVLDRMNQPHIAFVDGSNSLKYAKKVAGVWTTEVVNTPAVNHDYFLSIDLDSNNNVFIAFTTEWANERGTALKMASKKSSIWNIQTIDPSLIFGEIELKIDSQNYLHLMYVRELNSMMSKVYYMKSVQPTSPVTSTYQLTVANGSGDGVYAAGEIVSIAADAAPAGKVFDKWIGATVADANSPTTTLTMPAAATTVTSTYKDIPPATGDIKIYRVGNNLAPFGNTQAGIVNIFNTVILPATTANPAIKSGLAPASGSYIPFTSLSSPISNIKTLYATCSYPIGGTECSVDNTSTFNETTCPNNVCRNPGMTPAVAGEVTKVVFLYDQPPTISLTSPANNATFVAPASIQLAATASDVDGLISKVEFHQSKNGLAYVKIGEVTAPPYVYTWPSVTEGNYSIMAQAYDERGVPSVFHAFSNITVALPPAQFALTVANGLGSGIYTVGQSVMITANSPAAGKTFDKWTGATVPNENSPTTTLTMPAAATTVTATYKDVVNTAPVAVIATPQINTSVTADSTLSFSGFGNDAEEGQLNPSRCSWVFQYRVGSNPTPTVLDRQDGVGNGQFSIPATLTYPNIFNKDQRDIIFEVVLNVRDTQNLSGQSKVLVYAQISTLSLKTSPAGGLITFDGDESTDWGNVPVYAMVNYPHAIEVPEKQMINGRMQFFKNWTDGGARAHQFLTPALGRSYEAIYETGVQLTVLQGTGSDFYLKDSLVTITANAAPAGKMFDAWTGATVANVNSPTTTLVMPMADTTVTATYKDIPAVTYQLTVNNGTGGGHYTEGTVVNIMAGAASIGTVFDKWIGATVGNLNAPTTTLTMPATNITVTATYTSIVTPTPTPTPVPTPTPGGEGDSDGECKFEKFPNSSNGRMSIRFGASGNHRAVLTVYDMRGHEIQKLFDGSAQLGSNSITWDGKNNQGENVVSGTYLLVLESNGNIEKRKVAIVR